MRILMVASERLPYAKTGGLADVLWALPRALVRLGHEVDVVMPRYRGITAGARAGQLTVAHGGPGHDYTDNPERFAFLAQAALNWAVSSGLRHDVVHAHDWQAGFVPVLL